MSATNMILAHRYGFLVRPIAHCAMKFKSFLELEHPDIEFTIRSLANKELVNVLAASTVIFEVRFSAANPPIQKLDEINKKSVELAREYGVSINTPFKHASQLHKMTRNATRGEAVSPWVFSV